MEPGGIACFDSWSLGVCLLLPAWLPACLHLTVCSFSSANGELQSRGDTVKPSGIADYGAKY